MKKITLLFFMMLLGFLGHSQGLVENFDDASVTVPTTPGPWVLPSGTWQIYDNSVGTFNWTLNTTSTFPANTNPRAAYINRGNIGIGNVSRDYLVSPLITVPANPQLLFNTRTTLAGFDNTVFEVRAALGTSDPNDPASFTIVLGTWNDDLINTVYNQYEEKALTIPATVGTSMYLAFVKVQTQPGTGQTGERWLIDDIRLIEKCQDAEQETLTATTLATSANLTWDGTGNNQWEVHVLPAGVTFNPTAGTPIIVTGTPSVTVTATTQPTATPLQPLTTYVYYVRSICEFSNGEWIGPSGGFTTQALPPVCGGNFVDPGGANDEYSPNTNSTITICPQTPGDLVTVTFTAFATETNWDALYVFDGNSTSAPQIASTNGPGNVPGGLAGGYWGNAIPGPFESTSADGCLTFNFRSDGSGQYAGWAANVTCGPPPACPKPGGVQVGGVTSSNATVSWAIIAPATSWEVIAVPCGSPAPTPTTTGFEVSTNTYTFTNLNPSQCYNFYVRANCTESDNGMSDWTNPVTANTLVAPPVCGGTFTDEGGAGDYPNNANTTWIVCPQTPGDIVTVTFTAFNTEATWDALYVFSGNSTGGIQIPSTNGPGNVPGGLAGGFWGTAIPGPFESSSADGCLTFNFRSDGSGIRSGWVANVTCAPPPPCPKPIGFTASNPTSNSVVLSWTNVPPGTTWQVIAVACGAPAPTADTDGWLPATTTTFTYPGLNSSTCYDFYVRADCSSTANGISPWAGPRSATTLIAPPECGNVFVDEGGPANYPNNSNTIWTICPDNPGDIVSVVFTTYQTETNWDALYVFDGNSTSSPQIASTNGPANVPGGLAGGFWGNTIPGPFESSSADGCLTFWFRSDGSVQQQGWTANVICTPPPTCPKPNELTANTITSTTANLTWNQPANGEGYVASNWEILVLPQGSPVPTTPGIPTGSVYAASSLQPATCYSYYVRAICTDTDQSAWAGPFNFCTKPLNDECANAVTVPVNQDLLCVQTTNGSIAGATASSQASTCADAANDDVWYQFTATADTHIISFGNVTPATELAFGLFIGDDCGNMTEVSCTQGNSLIAGSLTPGAHYFIRVFSTSPQPQTSSFFLCVGTVPCSEAPSFCSTQPVTYQNATNVPSLGQIGCLFTTPNPAFYFLQVNQAGPLNYLLTQSTSPGGPPNLDVDYVVWGPFPDNATACAAIPNNPLPQGTCPNLHACSYSAAPTETMCLPNAQLCEVYVVMITNFANQPGFVTFTQTNATTPGGGQTECYPDNSFNYSQVAYCQNAPDPTPTLATGAVAGGVYSSTEGLIIDPATGTIDLSASAPGTYVVTSTYSISGEVTCENFENVIRTRTVIITPVPDASIAYPTPAVYCISAPVQLAAHTGTTGGTYSATPAGLFIDAISGTIVPNASTPGIYTVSYVIPASGGCAPFTATTQVEILDAPNVVPPATATYCDEYELPVLSSGAYYYQAGGQGDPIPAGTVVTQTTTFYVFATNGTCSDDETFTITINETPDLSGIQTEVGGCENYVVPTPEFGHYYDVAGGSGTIIDGTIITSPTVIYYGAANGSCYAEVAVNVSVGNIIADQLPDATACDCFTLPALSPNNNYYTGPNGTGTQLTAGQCITASQTVYIWAAVGESCSNGSEFEVVINATPNVGDFQAVVACDSYALPALAVGGYFGQPGGVDPITG
ncbi:fibronectin type III domain-containing protein, partial [Flavobacterium selenitireducens]|uniref:fibronectin type III domain-containing protein n=1 Tax=Flavobacterium selenitireducens TaxID=2722704 RepID=UPI00168B1566